MSSCDLLNFAFNSMALPTIKLGILASANLREGGTLLTDHGWSQYSIFVLGRGGNYSCQSTLIAFESSVYCSVFPTILYFFVVFYGGRFHPMGELFLKHLPSPSLLLLHLSLPRYPSLGKRATVRRVRCTRLQMLLLLLLYSNNINNNYDTQQQQQQNWIQNKRNKHNNNNNHHNCSLCVRVCVCVVSRLFFSKLLWRLTPLMSIELIVRSREKSETSHRIWKNK